MVALLPAGKKGGAIVSGGAKKIGSSRSGGAKFSSSGGGAGARGRQGATGKKTIGKEPVWSSGTTSKGEYLSAGDRKAAFKKSKILRQLNLVKLIWLGNLNVSHYELLALIKNGIYVKIKMTKFAHFEIQTND